MSPRNQPPSLKILMVAPTSFFSDYGGHIRILEEAVALRALGHLPTIVTYYMGKDVLGLDIRRTAALPYRTGYEVGSSRHKLAFDVYLLGKAMRVALSLKPDIIHGHMHEGAFIGGLIARILRVPLVFDFQGSLSSEMVDHGFIRQDGLPYNVINKLERVICHLPDAIMTSSLRAQELLSDHFGVSEDKMHGLPDCVDADRFDPQLYSCEEKRALRERLGLPVDHAVIVYLGLLADYQGIPDIIRAARKLKSEQKKVAFLLMGYPRVEYYQHMAEHLGVSDTVHFTGKVDYHHASKYLALGDIAISAKISATEGSGKVLNYMAMALPVVATDTPVHREYLGESGVYAPASDSAALARAIDRLLADESLRRDLGQKLRKRAIKHYSWKDTGAYLVDLYRDLL